MTDQLIDHGTEEVVDFRKLERYPKLISEAVPNEKCLPCALCEPVCPTKAIKVSFNKTREDLGPLRKGIKGSITVDQEKCNLCGRCARFCKAFLLLDKEKVDPRDLKPFEQLLVDEELCDYCGLCAVLCPEEAIKVEGEPLKVRPEFKFAGKINLDKDLCIGCGRCAFICPYQAIDVKRPFEGEIRLIPRNVPKCDPSGCHGCFNVCPASCWYVDEKGGIGVAKDQCIFCGACAKACPKEVMEVKRTAVYHTPLKETPWTSEWKDAIASITTGEKNRPDVSRTVMPPDIERPPQPKVEMPVRDPELLKLIDEALKPVAPALQKPKARYIMERETPDIASQKIVDRLKIQKPAQKKPEPRKET